MNLLNLSAKVLRAAANIQERIQTLEKELADILDGGAPSTATNDKPQGKRRMSAAGRARIAAAARKRWAEIRATKSANVSTRAPKSKWSPAARARLSKMAKLRWKKARAQGKSTL